MLNLLKTRRSIRKFKHKMVEEEKVNELLQAALMAPSSRGQKPWEFIVVTDKGLMEKLSQSRKQISNFLAGAPLGVAVIADSKLCDVWIEDATITATIIQLAAHSIGLDSCWIQIRERMHNEEATAEDYVREVLNIPNKYSVLCMLAIGYADEKKSEHDLNKLPYNKIHKDGF